MANIIDSPRFDITVSASLDYTRKERYVVRYGLGSRIHENIQSAIDDFNHSLRHAMECEGLADIDAENTAEREREYQASVCDECGETHDDCECETGE